MTIGLPGSIRVRITAAATVVVALVLAVTAVVILTVQRQQLVDNLDGSLRQRATTILAGLDVGDDTGLVAADGGDRFVQLAVGDEVVASSPNVAGLGPATDITEPDRATTVSDFDLEDDAYRVLIATDPDGRRLIVGENIDDVNDAVRTLALTLAAAMPVVVAALGALVWWLVGRTLEPVARVRREVTEIGAGGLDRRVVRPQTDDEIARLVDTMNDMLDRLEQAAIAQQSFIADASHELKGPVARMRTQIEVELAAGSPSHRLVESLLEDIADLQQLVEDLLHLARADAPNPTAHTVVDLDDVVMETARELRTRTVLSIDTSQVGAVQVLGDPGELQRLVRNLTDNAARHAVQTIEVAALERGDRVRIIVADDGPGVPPNDLERIFERFARLDASRSAVTGGTGLGLAIVRNIANRHKGGVWAEPAAPTGLRVVVDLPIADLRQDHR